MLSRRELVGKLAAGVAVAGAASVGLPKAAAAVGTTTTLKDAGQGEWMATAPQVLRAHSEAAASADMVAALPADEGSPASPEAAAPWVLIQPLKTGSLVAHGWHVADLTGISHGSCVLTLRNSRGRMQRVHLCRNDGRPQGLVFTDRFDLVVMNGGLGDLPTEEGLAQAVAAVAHLLATNGRTRSTQNMMTALLPQTERVRRFAGTMDRRLR